MSSSSVAMVLLCLQLISGSTSQKRFIQTNTDLLLTVTNVVDIGQYSFYWKFNNKNMLEFRGENAVPFPAYEGRVDFFPNNLSITLKKVQLNDSGMYTAVVLGDEDKILATYDITVEDPVSPVQLSVDHVTNSSESCNFTVSCSSQISSISVSYSFTCDRHSCEEPRPLTPDHAPSLQIYQSNVLIVCNHSNNVSWRNDTKDFRRVCSASALPKSAQNVVVIIFPVVVIVGLTGGALIIVVVVLKRRQLKNKTANTTNTAHEASEVPPVPQSVQSRADEGVVSSNPTYCFMGAHTGPASPQRPEDAMYAQVNKSSKPTH